MSIISLLISTLKDLVDDLPKVSVQVNCTVERGNWMESCSDP